jgi:cytochrome b
MNGNYSDEDMGTMKPDEWSKDQIRLLVWDLPTRLFHWLLVMLVIVSFVTGKTGGNAMVYHQWSGSAILTLLLFRVLWGIFGGLHSRFASFVRGPATVFRHAAEMFRKDAGRYIGHNPLGGWSILAMLASLFFQAGTGLFANDDIFIEGPLYTYVSKSTSDLLTRCHRINQDVIVALVAIHILAVLFYLVVKRENLIIPMLTGYKTVPQDTTAYSGNLVVAFLLFCFSAGSVFLLVR